MKKILIGILLVFSCFILVGCGKKEVKNDLVGEWKNDTTFEGLEFIYTFNEDGTGKYDAAGSAMNFKYKTEGDKLILEYTDEDMMNFETTYKVENDVLTIKDSMEEEVSYKKVK